MIWVIQNLFYEPLGIDYICPVASTIYSGIEESINIINNILITTEKLNVKEEIYINLSGKNDSQSLERLLFIDLNYWDWTRRFLYFKKSASDEFNWNQYNDVPFFNLQTCSYWFSLFPINNLDTIWISQDFSCFKTHFNYLNQYYKLNYLHPNFLKHHDYQSNTFYSFNTFWQNYRHNKTNINGFFVFWYEHYGSVEIGIKIWFNWFYNTTYPALEDAFFNSNGLLSTADLNYEMNHFFVDDVDMYVNSDWFLIKSDSK